MQKAKLDTTAIFNEKLCNFIARTPGRKPVGLTIIDRKGQPMTRRTKRNLALKADLEHRVYIDAFCCCHREKSKPVSGTSYRIMDSYQVYTGDTICEHQVAFHDSMRTPRNTLREIEPLLNNDKWKRLMIIAVYSTRTKKDYLKADIKKEIIARAQREGWVACVGNSQHYRGTMNYIDIRLYRQ